MTKVSSFEALRSIMTRKKFSSPNGYGIAQYGFSFYGYQNDFAGIYRRRPTKRGIVIVKMNFYNPVITHTVAQDAQRAKFAPAVAAWQALTEEQREALRTIANRRSKRAYTQFISQYLKTH